MVHTIESYEKWVETAPLDTITEMGENLINILNCQVLGVNLLTDN